jgi:hypothetical protein
MRRTVLALIAGLVAGAAAPNANASALEDRIWLESYLSFPVEDVKPTAAMMGYLGRVKQVTLTFRIAPGPGPGISRRTVTRFHEDGTVVDETDTDLNTASTSFHASYFYDDRRELSRIVRENYAARETETIDFAHDEAGFLVGAVFTTNGQLSKSVEIVNSSAGRPIRARTRLADGRIQSEVTSEYSGDVVTLDYVGASGASHVTTTFRLDAQGRPVSAQTARRDRASEVNYDGQYSYTYLPDGRKLFHGVERYPNAVPPAQCVFDRELFANGGVKSSSVVGNHVTCPTSSSVEPEVALDGEGNFTHTRLGQYERVYEIEYFDTPAPGAQASGPMLANRPDRTLQR